MKYIKKFERLQDDFDSASDEEKEKIIAKALKAMDQLISMETNFEIGDYLKYKEENKKGREFDNDIFIVDKIDGDDRPKKYQDRIQQGFLRNTRTGKKDFFMFHNFEECTEENIAQLKYNL